MISILLFGCFGRTEQQNKKLAEFKMDLSSANSSLQRTLLLFGGFNDDLSVLTYERYIEEFIKNETSSYNGVGKMFKDANQYLFAAKKKSFLIAIYSEELGAMLYDDSSSRGIDSVIIINNFDRIPDINEFISESGYTVVREDENRM